MVEIENLNFHYSEKTPLFNNFCWNMEKGESWSVLGSSGSGKTTLLHLLAGLKKAHKGTISINDEPLKRPRPETGLILQNHGLLPWTTVEKNIELGFKFRRFYGPDGTHCPGGFISDKKKEKQQVLLWLEKMGLEDLGKRYPHELSGGQQQRTAIARTLILKPDLLLMDEPFSSLDSPTRSSLQKLVSGLEKDSLYSRILVTHSIEEALIMSSRILILRDRGREPLIMENTKFSGSLEFDKKLYDQILTVLGDDFET